MSLEQERSALEELHFLEQEISSRIQRNPELYPKFNEDLNSNLNNKKKRSFREVLLQQHEINRFIDQYKKQKSNLQQSLNDAESRNQEIQSLKDPTLELIKFDEIYQNLKNQNDSNIVKPLNSIYGLKTSKINILSEFSSDLELGLMFSGEEYFGKYLDLFEFYEKWLNLIGDPTISYVKFLGEFTKFEKITKKNDDYLKYLQNLSNYLINFIKKSLPLYKIDELITNIDNEWNDKNQSNELYCEYCEREFAKKTVYDGHLNGKKHLKNVEKKKSSLTEDQNQSNPSSSKKNYEYYEFQIQKLVEPLQTKIQDTKLNTERRKALTERERIIELSQLEKDEELSSSDDDEENGDSNDEENQDFNNGVYNPLNLPIGFDGQPIPYWLWKLHGLGKKYNCEICGDYTYQGRKAFEKHFLEPRHIHGLKCLGIEPSNIFKDIISIEEARNLWNGLKKDKRKEEGEKENAVEVEDEDGNVMSEKVYNDLKKQGLI
ncbi:CWF complex protein sap61 [Wickerhamomyces ciferrii]|uniref:CWF complex protein sap61 n=1 Tax=Wickerhamomyces ciferrii (strain ATCC 14091 / BCRC 22168 / CBS 111 / JCM 3599 / NBRC 0793 / NRRL Y-1031 F-60-10) TaxID=1206466 RepID=K0KUL5_WICCF|nr:CWF complex protein sap61 [Wickerhamomyces ciferrii]CCH45124.1 CWF complex protein sap61 [Wickerhamomyces ciferrii]